MKKTLLTVLVFLTAAGSSFARGESGTSDPRDQRIESLEQRILELEAQNRAILAVLEELRPGLVGEQPQEQSPAQASPDSALPRAVEAGSSRLAFYGFVRVDAIFDDSRPNHPQFPNFILSEDPSLGPPGDSQFNFHPRLTRFGMNFSGPKIGSAESVSLSGKIEIDFQNGGSESRELSGRVSDL